MQVTSTFGEQMINVLQETNLADAFNDGRHEVIKIHAVSLFKLLVIYSH